MLKKTLLLKLTYQVTQPTSSLGTDRLHEVVSDVVDTSHSFAGTGHLPTVAPRLFSRSVELSFKDVWHVVQAETWSQLIIHPMSETKNALYNLTRLSFLDVVHCKDSTGFSRKVGPLNLPAGNMAGVCLQISAAITHQTAFQALDSWSLFLNLDYSPPRYRAQYIMYEKTDSITYSSHSKTTNPRIPHPRADLKTVPFPSSSISVTKTATPRSVFIWRIAIVGYYASGLVINVSSSRNYRKRIDIAGLLAEFLPRESKRLAGMYQSGIVGDE
nr:hypothetical protein CFP56_66131 [Quercus suber]